MTGKGSKVLGGLALGAALLLGLCDTAEAQKRTFKRKSCLDCHQDLSQEWRPLPTKHPGVSDDQCESCHIRHGLVAKLILKEQGNALCYSCHDTASLGLERAHVHTGLRGQGCTSCHDPHASAGDHLLKASGSEACYE